MIRSIEAVLLTGGASRRMGSDKSKLLVDGEPLGQRIARLLREAGLRVTVLGREPLEGCDFQEDESAFEGPLAALAGYAPQSRFVFVASCDLPGFSAEIVSLLAGRIKGNAAAIPLHAGRPQPLCALYSAAAFPRAKALAASGEKRIMGWIASLDTVWVTDVEPSWVANVNDPGEFRRAADGYRVSTGASRADRPGDES